LTITNISFKSNSNASNPQSHPISFVGQSNKTSSAQPKNHIHQKSNTQQQIINFVLNRYEGILLGCQITAEAGIETSSLTSYQ